MDWCLNCFGAHHVHHKRHGRRIFVVCNCCGDKFASFDIPDEVPWYRYHSYVKWLDQAFADRYF